MSNTLTPELLAQIFAQQSEDPFLFLITISHDSFSTIRLVNNVDDVISRGDTYTAYPIKVGLPTDDGEKARELTLEMDNTGLEFIDEMRSVTTYMDVKIEMILASNPDAVQMSFEDLKIQSITYNAGRISARLFLDSFLTTEMTSEKYTPQSYPGLF